MTSGIDPEANFQAIRGAAADAANAGASMLFTPEMAVLLDRKRSRAKNWIESSDPQTMSERLGEVTAKHNIQVVIGSMPVVSCRKGSAKTRWANRCFVYDESGTCTAQYDKVHMFDVELSTGESWHESSTYEPGSGPVTIESTAIGKLGLTICYDVRFPALFDALGQARCDAIAVPAAFTVPTGEAHWHVLLRARAIEASAFVIAAAQVGKHEDGRETYGHSLVVDAEIDLNRISEVRSQIPSLANRRSIAT
jgi:predicted amidohydrolase